MPNIFVISDTHFGHANILKFTGYDGKPLRVFSDANEMDEYIIQQWNSVVNPEDKVYHLGDVAMKEEKISLVGRCNGHKRLILGNHDSSDMKLYVPYFKEIYSTRLLDKILMSHIPIHQDSFGKAVANVFGHVHNNITPGQYGHKYYNVSIEVLDEYKPIAFEKLKSRINKQLEEADGTKRCFQKTGGFR